MFKKITSVLLAISFFILAISGVIMLFSKGLSETLRMDPFHELFALVMVIAGVIHIILNIKPLISYLKIKSVRIIFSSVVGLAIVLYIILMNLEIHDRGKDFHGYKSGTEAYNQFTDKD